MNFYTLQMMKFEEYFAILITIYMEELRKSTTNHSSYSRLSGRNSNPWLNAGDMATRSKSLLVTHRGGA
jgi:hypothetical protein